MNTILFDLDSTLLPMDQGNFEKIYFSELAKKCAESGYNPEEIPNAVYMGTKAMLKNDGTRTNEDAFWEAFKNVLGDGVVVLRPVLDDFYANEFNKAKVAIKENPLANPLINSLVNKGFTVVLATNPLFPPAAVETRLSWISLSCSDFNWVTTYNNSSFTKPNLGYYSSILEQIGKKPEECMMVGNDVKEDACAAELGLDFYLVTDHMLNTELPDPTPFHHGTFAECCTYLEALPCE